MVKKRPGHLPKRTCIGCGGKFDKKSLFRFGVFEDKIVFYDIKESARGRSAYFCKRKECIDAALLKAEKALRINIKEEQLKQFKEEAVQLLCTSGEDA